MSTTQDGSAEKRSEEPVVPEVHGDVARAVLRVGVVGDDPLRVLGLQAILEASALNVGGADYRVTVVAVALTALREAAALSAVLLESDGTDHLFELVATLRRERPRMRMIVIGGATDHEYIRRVIGAGARGYLTREAGEAEIRMALAVVSDGSVWAPRKVLAGLLDRRPASRTELPEAPIEFTAREVQVLRFLAAGMGNRQIAGEMRIDESTVKAHLSRLMRKAGAKNRVELMVQALRQGFTEHR